MGEIKTILLDVQEHLAASVPAIAYLDKDWGQLYLPQPPVKWPCVLLDVEEVRYSQLGHGCQLAESRLTVTTATMRLTTSSNKAPAKEKAYELIDLLEKIHDALHLFRPGESSPIFRTDLKKILSDSGKEAYQMTYQMAYSIAPPPDEKPKFHKVAGVTISQE